MTKRLAFWVLLFNLLAAVIVAGRIIGGLNQAFAALFVYFVINAFINYLMLAEKLKEPTQTLVYVMNSVMAAVTLFIMLGAPFGTVFFNFSNTNESKVIWGALVATAPTFIVCGLNFLSLHVCRKNQRNWSLVSKNDVVDTDGRIISDYTKLPFWMLLFNCLGFLGSMLAILTSSKSVNEFYFISAYCAFNAWLVYAGMINRLVRWQKISGVIVNVAPMVLYVGTVFLMTIDQMKRSGPYSGLFFFAALALPLFLFCYLNYKVIGNSDLKAEWPSEEFGVS